LRRLACAVLATSLGAGCAREPTAAPPPPTAAAPAANAGALRPLTTHDSDASPATPPESRPLPPGQPPFGPGARTDPQALGISGTVSVQASLLPRAKGAVALFLIARSSATQQILAVRKEESPSLPFRFRISGEDAMVAGTRFEGPLDLTARLSKSGDALPASGDLEGTLKSLQPGAQDVAIVIDSVRQ
jgi:hypothetical protein